MFQEKVKTKYDEPKMSVIFFEKQVLLTGLSDGEELDIEGGSSSEADDII